MSIIFCVFLIIRATLKVLLKAKNKFVAVFVLKDV